MARLRNEQDWAEVESLDPFSGHDEHSKAAWSWLEKLQTEGRLRSLDVMRLGNLVRAVYDKGRLDERTSRTSRED